MECKALWAKKEPDNNTVSGGRKRNFDEARTSGIQRDSGRSDCLTVEVEIWDLRGREIMNDQSQR